MSIYKTVEVSKMLLEFKCSNHKSIKEKVIFSLIAGSDNTSEELLKEFGNFRVLESEAGKSSSCIHPFSNPPVPFWQSNRVPRFPPRSPASHMKPGN